MRNIPVLIALLAIAACSNSSQSFKDFPANRWEKSSAVTFDIEVEEAGTYDMDFEFRHIFNGLPLREIPIQIVVRSNASDVFSGSASVAILNESGQETGDCTGDICDSRTSVFKNRQLPAGLYTVVVSQQTQNEVLPNVLGSGIRLEKQGQ